MQIVNLFSIKSYWIVVFGPCHVLEVLKIHPCSWHDVFVLAFPCQLNMLKLQSLYLCTLLFIQQKTAAHSQIEHLHLFFEVADAEITMVILLILIFSFPWDTHSVGFMLI